MNLCMSSKTNGVEGGTLHYNHLFLIGRADTAEVMAKLFQTMSTMMLPETLIQEANAECQPLSEL